MRVRGLRTLKEADALDEVPVEGPIRAAATSSGSRTLWSALFCFGPIIVMFWRTFLTSPFEVRQPIEPFRTDRQRIRKSTMRSDDGKSLLPCGHRAARSFFQPIYSQTDPLPPLLRTVHLEHFPLGKFRIIQAFGLQRIELTVATVPLFRI